MKYQEDYIQLSDRISWKNGPLVSNILNKNIDLDLTYNEGEFFTLAIESNSVEIIKTLLDYFNNNQLAKHTSGTTEYLLLKNKLRSALETAIEDVELSQEMKKVLSPYIDFESSENNDSFLEDEHLDNYLTSKDQIKVSTLKKSPSENDLHSTFDNSKENLLTEENLKRLSNNSSDEKLLIEGFLGHHNTYDVKDYRSDLAGNTHNTDDL
jgi:hypothetical protein